MWIDPWLDEKPSEEKPSKNSHSFLGGFMDWIHSYTKGYRGGLRISSLWTDSFAFRIFILEHKFFGIGVVDTVAVTHPMLACTPKSILETDDQEIPILTFYLRSRL